MDETFIIPMLSYLQTFSSEAMSGFLLLFSVFVILILLRFFGLMGLYTYNIIATILANIQVLKVAQFGLLPEPVALGTITFATIFLVSDIINEHYGKDAAQKSVWLSFSAQIIVMFMMLLTLAHKPEPGDIGHEAMAVLFLPTPRLVFASLFAFVVSITAEIWIFRSISDLTQRRHLWLRTSTSTIIAALIDNTIFSVLAWIVLSPHPVSVNTLIYTYILGAYIARVVVAILTTPVLYISYKFKKNV